jgi:hypothetical protein
MHYLCKTCKLSAYLTHDVTCNDCEERVMGAMHNRCKRCAKEQNKCAHCDGVINESLPDKNRSNRNSS